MVELDAGSLYVPAPSQLSGNGVGSLLVGEHGLVCHRGTAQQNSDSRGER